MDKHPGHDAHAASPVPTQGEDALRLRFLTTPDGLRAEVDGAATFDNTVAYWRAIVAEVHKQNARALLLIDRCHGPPLSAAQWQSLVDAMHGQGLEAVRIAHVKPHGLELIEYCELYALEAGISARVFYDEAQALLWLRHGMR